MQGVYGQNLLEGRIHFLIAVYLIASCFYPVGGEKVKWLPLPVIKYEKKNCRKLPIVNTKLDELA